MDRNSSDDRAPEEREADRLRAADIARAVAFPFAAAAVVAFGAGAVVAAAIERKLRGRR